MMTAAGTKPAITAIAPWFGSKRTMAPIIVRELGEHTHYLEPLCGSMAVLLAKAQSRIETVNDLHGDVINLARVIQSDELAPQLFERLQYVFVHDDVLAEARAAIVAAGDASDEPSLERALQFFALSWSGRNGESGLQKNERSSRIAVRWTANGGDPATRFRSAVASIPAWWARLQGVTILRRDAFEILERIDDAPGTAIYLDPPYLAKSDEYLHEFSNADDMFGWEDDHKRLATVASRFVRARVVISYYDHPRLTALYPSPKWTFIDCARRKNLAAQGQREANRAEAPEVLLVNGPSYGVTS